MWLGCRQADQGGLNNRPGDLDEWLDREIGRLSGEWRRQKNLASDVEAAATLLDGLGLLAVARESLSRRLIHQLFPEERAQELLEITEAAAALFSEGTLPEAPEAPLRFCHNYVSEFLLSLEEGTAPLRHLREARARLVQNRGVGDILRVHRSWHGELAKACQTHLSSGSPAGLYALRYALPHLGLAEQWPDFIAVATDPTFFIAKIDRPKGIHDFLLSVQQALNGPRQLPGNHHSRVIMNDLAQALCSHADIIDGNSLLALQQIHNELPIGSRDDDCFGKVCDLLAEGEAKGRPWLRMEKPSSGDGTRPTRLKRHLNRVLAVAFAPVPAGGGSIVATLGADHVVNISHGGRLQHSLVLGTDPKSDAEDGEKKEVTGYPPTGLAFVSKGQQLVCASPRGLHLIDAMSGEMRPSFGIATGLPHSLAAAPGVPWLVAIGYHDSTVRIWDVEVGKVVCVMPPPRVPKGATEPTTRGAYCCVAVSPDGKKVAVGCADHCINVWELDLASYRRGEELQRRLDRKLVPYTDRQVDGMAFSPDGSLLAVGGGYSSGMVEIWNPATRECVRFRAHGNAVWALAFAHDPTTPHEKRLLLCTGSFDRTVAVWDVNDIFLAASGFRPEERERREHRFSYRELTGRLTPRTRRAHQDVVMTAAVSPDNLSLATGGSDFTALLWNLAELARPAQEHPGTARSEDAHHLHAGAFHPDGREIIVGNAAGGLEVRCVESGELRGSFEVDPRPVRVVRFSDDGRQMAVGTEGGATVYRLENVTRAASHERLASGCIYALAFTHGSPARHLATGDAAGRVLLHSRTGQGPVRVCPQAHGTPIPQPTSTGATSRLPAVRALAFSRDDEWLASVGDDGRVILWNLATDETQMLTGGPDRHLHRIESVAFSADGNWLATGGGQTVKLWIPTGGTWTHHSTLRGHRSEVWTLAFSPCHRFLASGGRDTTARVWDVQTGRALGCLPCTNSVLALWFNARTTELRVADAGPDGRIPSSSVAQLRGFDQLNVATASRPGEVSASRSANDFAPRLRAKPC